MKIGANIGVLLGSLRGGSALAFFVVLILALFVVELPSWLLDILLVSNLLIALTLLLRSLYLEQSIKLSSFPTILVLTTLYRLALNIASTRLILLHGDQGLSAAGQVIRSFGEFVVQGEFVVGAVLFVIIAVVNFLVIAKGAARVAEVSARFSLDALPGRQLSIDSDFRIGNITKEQAAAMREDLDRQSQFFGAMDGAMKWVQGDAIAALVIAGINAVGGVGIGISRGMEFGDALNTFGILTIGDGLVSILPSLLISVAAGMIVTQASSHKQKTNASNEIFSQLIEDPKAVLFASIFLVVVSMFGLVGLANFPVIPFLAVGSCVLFILGTNSFLVQQRELSAYVDASPELLSNGEFPQLLLTHDKLVSPYQVKALQVEVDAEVLAPYLGLSMGQLSKESELYKSILKQREHLYHTRGILLPQAQVVENKTLSPGNYRIYVRERLVKSAVLPIDQLIAFGSPSSFVMFGFEIIRSAFNPIDRRGASWVRINRSGLRALQHIGVEISSPAQFLALEAIASVLESVDEILGVDEVKQLLSHTLQANKSLVEEVFEAKLVSYAEFSELLRRLVRERINIKDLKLILEGIAEYSALNPVNEDRGDWIAELHEHLRITLFRNLIAESMGKTGRLRTFALSLQIEEEFKEASKRWQQRTRLPLEPEFEQQLKISVQRLFSPALERGSVPVVILCSRDIRLGVQDYLARLWGTADWFRTIAYEELSGSFPHDAVGVVQIG
jgi:type III secretion protein V